MRSDERQAGLSIVTVVREGTNIACLASWAGQAAVDEIVVVELGVPSMAGREPPEASKLVVVRPAAEEPWAKGLGLNLGIASASRGTILVLDPGGELRGIEAYREAVAWRGGYLTGYGLEKGTSSEAAMFRHADWEAVGGFHEYLLGWGFEDEDLFNRLEDAGVEHRFFHAADCGRGTGEMGGSSDLGLELPEGLERSRAFQNNRNKFLAGLAPWNASMPLLRPRRFGRPGARVRTCELAPRTLLERRLQDCASYLAARFLHDAPESVAFPMLARMIDERSGGYAVRAGRQHQIDKAVAVRRRAMPSD